MSYMIAYGNCICCDRLFGFNPNKVPSVRIPPKVGPREPICRSCIDIANPQRIKNGLAPFTVHDDAYEPIKEYEDD